MAATNLLLRPKPKKAAEANTEQETLTFSILRLLLLFHRELTGDQFCLAL
jgi:hypothetical protein